MKGLIACLPYAYRSAKIIQLSPTWGKWLQVYHSLTDSFELVCIGLPLAELEELGKVQKFCLFMLVDYDELIVNIQIEIYSITKRER